METNKTTAAFDANWTKYIDALSAQDAAAAPFAAGREFKTRGERKGAALRLCKAQIRAGLAQDELVRWCLLNDVDPPPCAMDGMTACQWRGRLGIASQAA